MMQMMKRVRMARVNHPIPKPSPAFLVSWVCLAFWLSVVMLLVCRVWSAFLVLMASFFSSSRSKSFWAFWVCSWDLADSRWLMTACFAAFCDCWRV